MKTATLGRDGRHGRKPDPARINALFGNHDRYWTAKMPCKRNPSHVREDGMTERLVSRGECVLCRRASTADWQAKHPDVHRKHVRESAYRRYWAEKAL